MKAKKSETGMRIVRRTRHEFKHNRAYQKETFANNIHLYGSLHGFSGPNKKAAKRLAAFGACHKVLGVNYPSDVYVPIF